ncbi:MAG TPA: ATP-binding protein, partial [Magnetospirillum sp.]|nr:ATP-binding protein [Magnetospirillum sp.]
ISSYIGLIKRRLQAEDDAELHEFLGYAIDGAQRMDRMIIDMLDYSRIGRQSTPFQDVDLSQAVKQALSSLSAGIAESGAEIVVETPLPTVTGSASEIERLFQNLIGNAIKFRAQGRPPSVTINCRDGGNEWIISIADNGIGIDPAMHGRLFALFSRLVSQQQYEGTGIGLAACRKIAEHHGGRIWVESARDQGSVFHVALSKQRN